MGWRLRLGPFTPGKTETRLSMWRRPADFSLPLDSKHGRRAKSARWVGYERVRVFLEPLLAGRVPDEARWQPTLGVW